MSGIKAIVTGQEKTITRVPMLVNGVDKGWEVRTGDGELLWGAKRTITGTTPMTLKGYGIPLDACNIIGNGQQTGTPTPDNIIMPTFCGVRTENLFDPSTAVLGKYINAQGVETNSTAPTPIQALNHTDYIDIQPNTNYTYHYKYIEGVANMIALCWFDTSKSLISRDTKNVNYNNIDYTLTATSPANAAFCVINFAGYLPNESMELSFNSGRTALPYEPYGYKIPVTCAGQTTPVYLGEVETTRKIKKLVLDGTEDWKLYKLTGATNVERFYIIVSKSAVSPVSIISTHFLTQSDNSDTEHTRLGGDPIKEVYIYISRSIATTVGDFKSYLSSQYAAGTPVTVWYVLAEPETGIVNEPLYRIGDYADTLTTTTPIPTVKGDNTLTVETELQPSQISVTGHIKSIS